jgi:Cu2+-exporting ATPase
MYDVLPPRAEAEPQPKAVPVAHGERPAAGSSQIPSETFLRVGGMHCTACAQAIEDALRHLDGVVWARVDAASQSAVVRWLPGRTEPARFIEAIEATGYTALSPASSSAHAMRRAEARTALWRLFVAGLCSMQVMMLAAPAYLGEAGDLAPEFKRLLDWGGWVMTLPVLCFSAAPFFAGAWRALRGGRIGMDVPVALGIAVAFVASTGAAFAPGGVMGHEVYFDSLTMFVTFLLAGRWLEMRARHRAEALLEGAMEGLPQVAWYVRPDGQAESVPVQRLRRGDVLRVPVGQAFAADGVLVAGHTEVDESMLSGESKPLRKGWFDRVLAGSMNLGGPVDMRIESLGVDTRYEQIMALTREAQAHRTGSRRLSVADRWAGPFLWLVLILAAGAALVWNRIDPERAVWVAVSVLIVTCPCALSLAAPSALMAAAGAMARKGLLLRRLDAIEGLARMQALFVDKTGTLTDALATTARMSRVGRGGPHYSDAFVQGLAADMANRSSHPAARAIASLGASAHEWQDIREVTGHGMEAVDEQGMTWRLGARGWMTEEVSPDPQVPVEEGVWLSREGRLVACFELDEVLRADAASSVHELQQEGVQVCLLSGDARARAARVAFRLGLNGFQGEQQPADKLLAVRRSQQQGLFTAMLGDGINDAPVLAQADLSIAMGDGTGVARARADGVLVSNGLGDLVRARRLARKALRIVHQNLAWAAFYNLACVPMALAGWLPPWAAGLGMATSSLVVVLNAARLTRG